LHDQGAKRIVALITHAILSGESIQRINASFIDEVIEANGLAFDGSGYLQWEGLICLQEIGHCTDEHRALVTKWLEARKLKNVETSELFDIWWD
jgi:uncharacterized protein YggL (DUF469 family)